MITKSPGGTFSATVPLPEDGTLSHILSFIDEEVMLKDLLPHFILLHPIAHVDMYRLDLAVRL